MCPMILNVNVCYLWCRSLRSKQRLIGACLLPVSLKVRLVAVSCPKLVVHFSLAHRLFQAEHAHSVGCARPRLTRWISNRYHLVPLRRVITSIFRLVRVDVDVVVVTKFVEAGPLTKSLLRCLPSAHISTLDVKEHSNCAAERNRRQYAEQVEEEPGPSWHDLFSSLRIYHCTVSPCLYYET